LRCLYKTEFILTKEAFKNLFDQYFDTVRNYIFYRSGDVELATDIAQDTFMKIWEKKLKSSKNIKGLLFKIAGDLFINQHRKHQTAIKFNKSVTVQQEEVSPEEDYIFQELKIKYEQALTFLPENQRIVFLLSRVDGLKYREIAEHLNISIKTVEKRMSKTLAYMKHVLKQ